MPKTNSDSIITGTPQSKFDSWFGTHFTTLSVGILFLFTITCFTIIISINPSISDKIITGFFTILGTLAGFFVGKVSRSNKD